MIRNGGPREEHAVAHVVVAPDKFKGSLTAAAAAAALARGIERVRPGLSVHRVPVADGGDGTVDAALAAGFRPVTATVHGPTGEQVTATIAIRDGVAVVEAATAGGLARLPGGRLAPLTSSSYGVGELLLAAIDAGARTVVLGVGGSASTDGGAGLVQAVGGRVLDADGADLSPGGGALADVATVDLSGIDPRIATVDVILASDVDNPLLGPHGAASVFGPQKGADPALVALLDDVLRTWSTHVDPAMADAPGAGAAGGIGFAALAVLGATRRSGIDLLLDLIGFATHLPGAALVITGEGSLDEQSLHGKAPIGVVDAAGRAGVPAIAVAGRSQLNHDAVAKAGITAVYTLTDLEPDLARCIADADRLLEELAVQIAEEWL
ncbi:MAG TPA: glycerate kinase [Pseudonocardiaceae bacterium]|jgi:glycerate kinase|nr:glycerate kinase [Pseudonocardiaceae bacterium]